MPYARTAVCLAVSVLLVAASVATAAFDYGDLSGVTVVYEQVREDSATDPGMQLFGTPTVTDDSLTFSPMNFAAYAAGAGGYDLTDGTLAMTIRAIGDNRVEKIRFAEWGDYTLGGSSNGTADTNVAVAAAMFIRITEIDGVGVQPITLTANLTFDPSDGVYNLVDDRGTAVIWNGSVELDITAAILEAGRVGKATCVDFSMDNTLMAFSEAGTVAHIKKKQMEGVSITTIVPEPATMGLLALGALLAARRRRP